MHLIDGHKGINILKQIPGTHFFKLLISSL